MFLALKEIKKEKSRFLLIISIFVLISYLVYFLLGLAYGLAVDNRTAVDAWDGQQIVLSAGSNKNIQSSMIDQDVIEKDLEGKDYSLVNLGRSSAYVNGKEDEDNIIDIAIIGSNKDSKIFPKILEGNNIENDDEVIASLAIKDEKGLKLGDELKLTMNDKVLKIVGFTDDYKFNTSPVIYSTLETANPSAMLYRPVEDNNQENIDATAQPTKKIPNRVAGAVIHNDDNLNLSDEYDIVPIDEFINKIPGYYAQLLTFGLMIGFLIIIASIVLGVFLYIITIQKKETFGIMKIQGISNSYISRSVIIQTIIVSVIGLAIGMGLTYLTETFLPVTVPFNSNEVFYAVITVTMIITSLIGAIFSIRSVAKVDPLEVLG